MNSSSEHIASVRTTASEVDATKSSNAPHDLVVGHAECDIPLSPVQQYQQSHTLRGTLTRCIPRHRPCNLADCRNCGERVAAAAIEALQAKFAVHQRCSSFRLSLARNVSLDVALRQLAVVRSCFLKRARLPEYLLNTEVTVTAEGWNAHLHLLVFGSRGDLGTVVALWDEVAEGLGFTPSHHAQRSETVPAIEYVLKPRLGSGPGSLRSTLSRASAGDPVAAALWAEWDAWRAGNQRTRFRFSYRRVAVPGRPALRDQYMVEVSDRDIARLTVLESFTGAESKRVQAWALGISDSTVARRRRQLPEVRLDEPGRIYFRISE